MMICALVLAVSAQAQQVKYTVKGVSKDNGKMVYLEDRLTSKPVDSTLVAKGKFVFKGQADKNAILAITFDKDNSIGVVGGPCFSTTASLSAST